MKWNETRRIGAIFACLCVAPVCQRQLGFLVFFVKKLKTDSRQVEITTHFKLCKRSASKQPRTFCSSNCIPVYLFEANCYIPDHNVTVENLWPWSVNQMNQRNWSYSCYTTRQSHSISLRHNEVKELSIIIHLQCESKQAQLTLTNPCDSKGCKNCSNSTCFVSFHRIPFPQISNYQCIASRGMFRL